MARLHLDQANSLAILDVVYRVTRRLMHDIMLVLEAVQSQWQITMVIYVAVRCLFGFGAPDAVWRGPRRCTTIKNPLPPLCPLTPRCLPQHILTHFVTPASIDAPATTLLAARPRPPLRRCDVPRVIPSLTSTSTCCRTALQSLIRLTPRCDLPDLPDLPRPTA
jgi:hypothetical protein